MHLLFRIFIGSGILCMLWLWIGAIASESDVSGRTMKFMAYGLMTLIALCALSGIAIVIKTI